MVLGAALLHAAWNALVKVNADRLAMMATMMASQAVVAVMVVPFVAFPTPEAWPYIWASAGLHTAYYAFLILAYRYGDLSHVYPLARGSAPMIVAFASLLLVGETLSQTATLSVVLIALGIMSLTLSRDRSGVGDPRAILYALGTGVFIAAYTVVDGLGARLAASAHSYIFWLNLIDGIPITVAAVCLRWGNLAGHVKTTWKPGVLAGMISMLAYWIVVWAMTHTPMALVSAVRETSMVFAVLFGVVFLGEKLNLLRFASIAVTLAGAVLLRLSK